VAPMARHRSTAARTPARRPIPATATALASAWGMPPDRLTWRSPPPAPATRWLPLLHPASRPATRARPTSRVPGSSLALPGLARALATAAIVKFRAVSARRARACPGVPRHRQLRGRRSHWSRLPAGRHRAGRRGPDQTTPKSRVRRQAGTEVGRGRSFSMAS
jgi:hypothetical protein